MRVRILQGFRDYEPGQVFDDWPDGMCEILIERGLIERATEVVVERSIAESDVERAEVAAKAVRKPRK